MLTTIKGTYSHGQIILSENPLVQSTTEVIVTFLTNESEEKKLSKRKMGGLEGKVPLPEDFNEPLEDLKDYM